VSAVAVLLAVSMLTFAIQSGLPGDEANIIVGQRDDLSSVQREQLVAQVRRNMGLDKPVPVQYAIWLGHAVRFDLGRDQSGASVRSVVAGRVGPSLELALLTVAVSLPLAIALAVASVRSKGRVVRSAANAVATVGFVTPAFWLGLLLIIAFAVKLRWLPAGGYASFAQSPVSHLRYLAMPLTTLVVPTTAIYYHYLRQSLVEALGTQYARTALAKGMTQRRMLYRHALPNALLPTLTVLGIQFGQLIGGVVVVERVFSWPGVGGLLLYAVERNTYATLVACVLAIAAIYVVVSTLVELCYGLIDPRLRRA
jgi:peptide/nickel transport system permease protein